MKGLSKEARLSAVRQLRVALAKKMKHELNESPDMEKKEQGEDVTMPKGPSVSIHVMTGKEVNKKAIQEQREEEAADSKDKTLNTGMAEALKKFMHDERVIKPKGVAKVVYGGPKVAEVTMTKNVSMGERKKPGRPKRG